MSWGQRNIANLTEGTMAACQHERKEREGGLPHSEAGLQLYRPPGEAWDVPAFLGQHVQCHITRAAPPRPNRTLRHTLIEHARAAQIQTAARTSFSSKRQENIIDGAEDGSQKDAVPSLSLSQMELVTDECANLQNSRLRVFLFVAEAPVSSVRGRTD